jgi:hypothetical protein
MKKLFTNIILIAILIVSGCKKKEIPGPKGDPGPAGVTTTVTVSAVKSSTVLISNWAYSSNYAYSDISWGEITQEIIDKGALLVYIEGSPGLWGTLPLTMIGSAKDALIDYDFQKGKATIYITYTDLSQPSNLGQFKFKLVAVPG